MKFIFFVMVFVNVHAYAGDTRALSKNGNDIVIDLSDIKTIHTCGENICIETSASFDGGVMCSSCPGETPHCAPRPDCKSNLYE